MWYYFVIVAILCIRFNYVLYSVRFILVYLKSLFKKDAVILTHIHGNNVARLDFPYHDGIYTIFFPYNQRLKMKMVNTEIYLRRGDKDERLNLLPGLIMPYTATQCGGENFRVIDDLSQEEKITTTL